jgi:glycosyltransferase involved in cell wall biosynthesis
MDDLRGLKDGRAADQVAVLEQAKAIVCNSEALKRSYAEFADKITVIPLGVDTDFWRPGETRLVGGRRRVIFVGDSTAQKGWLKVVSLASAREDLDWTFVLKSLVEKLMPPGRLEVAVPRERVRALLHESDVFILGSVCEGGSQAPLEAMACGLPVVMPPAGDFATWRPSSYFEVRSPFDPIAMNFALNRCLAAMWPVDPRADLMAAGRYTLDSVEGRWRALLEGILP